MAVEAAFRGLRPSPFTPAVIPFFWSPGATISANKDIDFPPGLPAVIEILYCVRWRLTEGTPTTISPAVFDVVKTAPSGNQVLLVDWRRFRFGVDTSASDIYFMLLGCA